MTSGIDELDFDGVPFDTLAAPSPSPAPVSAPAPPPATGIVPAAGSAADLAAEIVGQLHAELLIAHRAAVQVQTAWQDSALQALRGGDRAATVPTGVARGRSAPVPAGRLQLAAAAYRPEGALEPLTPALVTALAPDALDLLHRGDAARVFGPRHERDGPGPALVGGPLQFVSELRPGGPAGVGVLRGLAVAPRDDDELRALGVQVAQVLAGWLGLPTVVPAARFGTLDAGSIVPIDAAPQAAAEASAAQAEVLAEITAADLLPRPWLRVDVEIRTGGQQTGLLRGLAVEVREVPGTPVGTRRGGNPPALPVRRGVTGRLAAVDELALATASVGDLVPALGPEFARYAHVRATRPPTGGLRLVGRVMAIDGTRGDLSGGATGETEYDSAADAWYYGAAPSPSVPNVVLMETSLQSALLLGYHLGATLTDPDEDYCLRNLDGAATLHREVDLRGRTICQHSELLTTTVLSGAVLQSFSYRLWLDGEDRDRVGPFYSGQSLFGFFNATALANQTGLDNGTFVASWLEQHPEVDARTVTIAGRGGAPHASAQLDLVPSMEVVDGGGVHGRGYLRARRAVVESDWFFARHFHLDPVMPGSLGVEAVIQVLQEWLVDTGALDRMAEPEFVVPAGLELAWRYRGQILAGDGEMTVEVHVKRVEHGPGRVRVVADASVWKPGLRIYELTDAAAEAREKGAPSW